jgi:hypothetical protein
VVQRSPGDAEDAAGSSQSTFTVGQRVRVAAAVDMKHVPGHKQGFDARGAEGTVTRVYEVDADGSTLTPNHPVKVQFDEPKRWTAHFDAEELEAVER